MPKLVTFEPINEEVTIQVISFVLEHACKEGVTFVFDRLALVVDSPDSGILGPRRCVIQLGHRQTTLFGFMLFVAPGFKDGVDDVALTVIEVEHEDCLPDADLWSSKPDPLHGFHSLVHRIDQTAKAGGTETTGLNGCCFAAQDRVWNGPDG